MKHPVRTILGLLLLPAALLLQLWAGQNRAAVESVYSRTIYPVFSSIFSTLFGLAPFSVAEVLLAVIIVVFVVRLVLCLVRLRKTGPVGLWHGFLRLASFFCTMFFLFTVLWGLNYDRLPLAQSLQYKTGTPTKAELTALVAQEVAAVNALSPQLSYDKNGHSYEDGGFSTVQSRVRDAFGRISATERPSQTVLPRTPVYPKAVFPSALLARFGIQGIFIPFTFEPTVDTSYPPFILPFAAAHESAHLKGFAREEEANFLAYLAVCSSPDIYFQYSGHMNALLYLDNALSAADAQAASTQMQTLDAHAKADIAFYDAYVNKYEGKLTQTANKVNDTYLKSNGEAGVASYDAFVDLLCDRYRTQQAAQSS